MLKRFDLYRSRLVSKRASPSPLPSPAGRGRTVRRFAANPATVLAGGTAEIPERADCCPLSQRERVRVRENGANTMSPSSRIDRTPAGYRVQLEGADAEHTVEDVAFENVAILGQPLTRTTPGVSMGKNVGKVRFDLG